MTAPLTCRRWTRRWVTCTSQCVGNSRTIYILVAIDVMAPFACMDHFARYSIYAWTSSRDFMQRRQWLKEALEAISSSPTESQLMQTAITVLRVSVCAVHFTACLYNHRYNTSRIVHVAMFMTTLYMTLDVSL